MLTLEQIVRTANKKREKLGIKISESNYHPAFKQNTTIKMIEDSPFIVEETLD